MEKNKKVLTIALLALLISITVVGIAFAVMNQTLTIDGGATFSPANWGVRFKASSLSKVESGEATGTTPTIGTATIGTYAVTLTQPGDSVTYTFVVENNGDIDAIIDEFTMGDPKCTGTGTNATSDAEMVCTNLVYTLTNDSDTGTPVEVGQTLGKKDGTPTEKTMVLKIEYPLSTEEQPEDDVTIEMPTVSIIYVQD